jgi:DNA processing protein
MRDGDFTKNIDDKNLTDCAEVTIYGENFAGDDAPLTKEFANANATSDSPASDDNSSCQRKFAGQTGGNAQLDEKFAGQNACADAIYEIWLTLVCGFNPYQAERCVKIFGSARAFYERGRFSLRTVREFGLDKSLALGRTLDEAHEIIGRCRELGVEIIAIDDEKYPERLRATIAPPRVIYSLGKFPDIDNCLSITIVGCREPSSYGIKMAKQIAYDLASCGALIVSGMALGIDGCAHIGALDANMPTLAALPCGVNMVYPKSHADLYNFILKDGCVISEYPPDTPVLPQVFEVRNRILAGLSMGVVVIEAELKSGTSHTVRHALENGRDCFALMGNATSKKSEFPNQLICEGAIPIRGAEDVLAEYFGAYSGFLENNLAHIKRKYYDESPKKNRGANKQNRLKSLFGKTFNFGKKKEKLKDAPVENPKINLAENAAEIKKKFANLGDSEKHMVKFLARHGKVHIDALARESSFDAASARVALTKLELFGVAKLNPGGVYELNEDWIGDFYE